MKISMISLNDAADVVSEIKNPITLSAGDITANSGYHPIHGDCVITCGLGEYAVLTIKK